MGSAKGERMKCALIGAAVLQVTAEHVTHDSFVPMAATHWEVSSYTHCKGNTLWKGNVQKAEDCALKCIDDDHCLAFEYDHDKSQPGKAVPGGCTLKRQGSSKSSLLQVNCESEEPSHTNHFTIMLAVRHNHSTPSSVAMKGGKRWTVTNDFDCYGNDLGPPKKITAGEDAEEECAAHCAAMPGCVGFSDPHREGKTWNAALRGERVCYMKRGATHVHIPSKGVLCPTGSFTPSWNYYSLMPEETCPGVMRDTAWLPLDMPGHSATLETSAADCQGRCARIGECAHWSYWSLGRQCHVSDMSAYRAKGWLFFTSGPKGCSATSANMVPLSDNEEHDLGEHTYVPQELACVDVASSYHPAMSFPAAKPIDVTQVPVDDQKYYAVWECQKRCRDMSECAHFTLYFPSFKCDLATSSALRAHPIMSAISGPPSCSSAQSFAANYDNGIDFDGKGGHARDGVFRGATVLLLSAVIISLAASATIRVWRRSPRAYQSMHAGEGTIRGDSLRSGIQFSDALSEQAA